MISLSNGRDECDGEEEGEGRKKIPERGTKINSGKEEDADT